MSNISKNLDRQIDGWMYFINPKLGNYCVAAAVLKKHKLVHTKIIL